MNEENTWQNQQEDEADRDFYAISYTEGAFVPCPFCGAPIECPDCGFRSEKEAVLHALENCECRGAREWREKPGMELLEGSPCASGKLVDGMCTWEEPATACTREKCSAYHPERCAADLYAQAFERFAAREELEKMAEAHRPTELLIRYAERLPEPIRWTKPAADRRSTGVCKYCGQLVVLAGCEGSQEAANCAATAACNCPAGRVARRRANEQQILAEMFQEAEEGAVELLARLADLTRAGMIAPGSAVKMTEGVTAKIKLKDDTVTVVRTEKREHQHSL